MTCLMKVIPRTEETLAQKTHCSVKRTSEGSIIILLQTETGDAVEKLRQFIESGDISNFLKQLFLSKDGRKLLTKDKYTIKIEIKKVQSSATGKTMHVNKGFFFRHKPIQFLSVKRRWRVSFSYLSRNDMTNLLVI